MLKIDIDENNTIAEAIWTVRSAWIKANIKPQESFSSVARRLNVSYRTIVRWVYKQGGTKYHQANKILSENIEVNICKFCGSNESLVKHHIISRNHEKLINLCEKCHKTFHTLNKAYKKRQF